MRFLVKRVEAAGFRVCRFSFCTICGIIYPRKPDRPLNDAH
nr:MAG TPA: anaerobic nitric oxide reductase flavorubredoxin [Caudoviricetes sp.]DAJ19725.1 MAG TPA: anaerobic nitric oxide reductase flavorubredoxin [Siphoviridae sp. cthBp9]